MPASSAGLFPLFASSSRRDDLREIEGDEPRAVEVGDFTGQPATQVDNLVSLALRLERGITATMVARVSDRRAGQELLSSTVLHQRWCLPRSSSNEVVFLVGR